MKSIINVLGMVLLSCLPVSASMAASCDGSNPVGLVLAGSASKQTGDSLQIDYCFMSGSSLDLYAAMLLPDKTLVFLSAAGSSPAFSTTPTPFLSNAPAQTGALASLIKVNALPDIPTGTYTFYSLAVPPGKDLSSANWLGKTYASSTFTFSPKTTASTATSAFFYQTVDPAKSIVRAGATADGKTISTYNVDLVYAANKAANTSYGDPVFSRLSSGKWAMTGWTAANDTRGTGLLYHEASCPAVVDANVRVITASSASGCQATANPSMSKTSQIFAVEGSNYIFTNISGEIYLTRLTDSTRTAADLKSVCVRQTAAKSFSELAWGESTKVVSKTLASGLLLSDTGIARRKDGTWVLFIKGIASNNGCAQGSLCELCARGVYRTTSSDLITWSALEKVVSQASVPEAVTYPDGSVWLYHQNFAKACAANDSKLAERAAISGVYEGAGNVMSSSIDVKFNNEPFETDTTLHYPTNGNPIALPDAAAMAALDACMGGSAK